MRLVFMGTPEFSVPTLAALLEARYDVVAVYSQPPRQAGRGLAETKGAVHAFAEARGIKVLTPVSLKAPEAQAAFRAHDADAAVVVAYGLLLHRAVLEAPRHGCYNLHASKLPRWRGAAPIQRAIMAGDTETASMVMRMDEGLDTGDVCASRAIAIGPDTTAGELHDALSSDGAQLIAEAMADLAAGRLIAKPQPDVGVTYAQKIAKAETRIDFDKPATEVHNHVRGLSPFPGAWFEAGLSGKRERIKVLRSELLPGADRALAPAGMVIDGAAGIACGLGGIRLIEVQRAGKRPQRVEDFLRGFSLMQGSRINGP
ncbi:MAG: methionyl-tRNA formyltransferase [Hyphomicrobiaceae bacterium]|nr:methionyl-tRNA formyltransferase [Hyphomicrobiaceae bacterium]